jgi:ubiquitin-conjugating enzyme E2 J1
VAEVIVEMSMEPAQRDSNGQMFVGCTCPRFEPLGSSLARRARPRHSFTSRVRPSVSFFLTLTSLFLLLTCIQSANPHPCPSWQPKAQPSSVFVRTPYPSFPTPATNTRVVKEAAEITTNPTPDLYAAPLEENLFEWHFTIRGAPDPSPFAGGVYHGRIILPPAYPLRPPSFRFLTPSGRFEPNREICLSISGHHEETWQPAWGIRTALVAIRSFMDTDAGGQVGGMSAPDNVRKALAEKSRGYSCAGCGKGALAILEEQEQRCKELGVEATDEEDNPLVGKIGLIEPKKDANATEPSASSEVPSQPRHVMAASEPELPTVDAAQEVQPILSAQQSQSQPPTSSAPHAQAQPQSQPPAQLQQPPLQPAVAITTTDAWIDKAIIGIVIALVLMILRRAA